MALPESGGTYPVRITFGKQALETVNLLKLRQMPHHSSSAGGNTRTVTDAMTHLLRASDGGPVRSAPTPRLNQCISLPVGQRGDGAAVISQADNGACVAWPIWASPAASLSATVGSDRWGFYRKRHFPRRAHPGTAGPGPVRVCRAGSALAGSGGFRPGRWGAQPCFMASARIADVLGRMIRGSTCSPCCKVARTCLPLMKTGFSSGWRSIRSTRPSDS